MRVVSDSYTMVCHTMVCPPVREIIHSLLIVDYLLLQADKPWYNCYIIRVSDVMQRLQRGYLNIYCIGKFKLKLFLEQGIVSCITLLFERA